MAEEASSKFGPPPREGVFFRGFIGAFCVIGSFAALAGLYMIEIPQGNKEALLLAIGLVLGWGGNVVASEFGSSTSGRKLADVAVNQMRDNPPGPGVDAQVRPNAHPPAIEPPPAAPLAWEEPRS